MRKEEEAEGRQWHQRYFTQVQQLPHVEELLAKIGGKLEPDQTGGVWQWDEEKYKKTRPLP
jgi:hypothetical protein